MKVIIVTCIGEWDNQNYQLRINLAHIISYKQIHHNKYKVEIALTDDRIIPVCDSLEELDSKINSICIVD